MLARAANLASPRVPEWADTGVAGSPCLNRPLKGLWRGADTLRAEDATGRGHFWFVRVLAVNAFR